MGLKTNFCNPFKSFLMRQRETQFNSQNKIFQCNYLSPTDFTFANRFYLMYPIKSSKYIERLQMTE